MRRLLSVIFMLWLAQTILFAATGMFTCKGTVVDGEGEPIIGASIVITGSNAVGTTNYDGNFSVKVPDGTRSLTFSYVGCKNKTVPAAADMGKITLETSNEVLKDVVVTQSLARTRQTPVAISQVNKAEIDVKLGGQELPEVLNTTPGVWATKDGGGFGDAKINMRGFKSANVAVLVNGIPINDMEWGGVYWSNWAGLSDVASNIQTQRGLGAAILSSPSIGGTINITTQSFDAEKGGRVWYGMGNDGMNEYGVKVSTGMMKNGWAVTVLGSHKWGDGYVQGTEYSAYNYFINVSKRINDKNTLSLTAFGAPQQHYKRSSQDGLTILNYYELAKKYMDGESMYRYNPTFGYDLQGQRRSSNRNTYHKPQISLAHVWKIDNKSSLSTTIYASIASGGGQSGQGRGTYNGTSLSNSSWYGSSNGTPNTLFRNPDGTFGYNLIQLMNRASTTGSNMVMSESNNSHNWYGLISTYNNKFLDNKLNFLAGIDLRYYVGFHNNKITDLYDGDYFMDDGSRKNVKVANNAAAADPNWKYEKLGVGDVVYRDYEGRTNQEGIYAQAEYTCLDKRLNVLLAGSLSNTGYQRIDHFYYDKQHEKSDTYNFLGGTIKGGANYNIDRHNNVFVNAGFISRAPFFSQGVFLSSAVSNAANPDPINEKTWSVELGYGYHSTKFTAELNGYYTMWLDKTTTRSGDMSNGDRYYLNMSGVNARHMGIEINMTYIPVRWLEINGMLSLGDYTWKNNPKGYFYNQAGQPLADLRGTEASGILAENHAWSILKQDGVKVGGSAQTTAFIGATFRPSSSFRIGADWKVAARNYSDYTLSSSSFVANKEVVLGDPWKMPWGNTFDIHASYTFNIGNVKATLYGNLHNLFNYQYMVDALTPATSTGTWENAYGFYSFGRTYTMKLRINF